MAPGDDPRSETTSDGSTTPSVSTDGGANSGDPPVAPCDVNQAARLQADVDTVGARYSKFDFLLAVKTPSCGLKFFSAGPNKYTEGTIELIGSATR